MASFRRTLSPLYHDRLYQNGVGAIPPSSPSHKLASNAKYSSPLPALLAHAVGLRRFLAGLFVRRYARKGQWRRELFRCLLCFFLGFLLGMFPFGHVVDDIRRQDISFEIKPAHANAKLVPDDHVLKREEGLINPVSLNGVKQNTVNKRFDFVPRKQLIVVTPTYNRAHQSYFLYRLAQVLRLVPPPILWIVVEMKAASLETAEILRKTGVMYRHLVCTKNSTNLKDRGVHQRNTALEHIEHHRLDGIVYFADDDNVYSLELFETMRDISTILWDPRRWQRPSSNPIRQLDTVKEGFQETTFIAQLLEDESQMEGLPPGCSKIMNWHLHLDACSIAYPKDWLLLKNLDVVIPIK